MAAGQKHGRVYCGEEGAIGAINPRTMRPMKSTLVSLVAGHLCAGCVSHLRMTRPPVAPPASAVYTAGAGGAQLFTLIEGNPEPRAVVWYVLGPEIVSTVGNTAVSQAPMIRQLLLWQQPLQLLQAMQSGL